MNKTSKIFSTILVASSLFLWTSCKPSDTKIAEQVKEKVGAIDPTVNVAVAEGAVTLTGQVADDAIRMNIETASKEVKGVKSVINSTTVAVPMPVAAPVVINPDDAISKTIQESLVAKNITGVTVTIAEGVVTLTGNAKKSDLQTIMQVTNESHPKKVENKLTLK